MAFVMIVRVLAVVSSAANEAFAAADTVSNVTFQAASPNSRILFFWDVFSISAAEASDARQHGMQRGTSNSIQIVDLSSVARISEACHIPRRGQGGIIVLLLTNPLHFARISTPWNA